MSADHASKDRWLGRLVDVQGFEGELALDLRLPKSGKSVSGSYDVSIGVNHMSSRQHGAVSGTLAKDRLKLVLEAGKEPPVTISLEGSLRKLQDGGLGLCATYRVSTRGYSPLQEGVVVASSGRRVTSVAIEPEISMPLTHGAKGGRS